MRNLQNSFSNLLVTVRLTITLHTQPTKLFRMNSGSRNANAFSSYELFLSTVLFLIFIVITQTNLFNVQMRNESIMKPVLNFWSMKTKKMFWKIVHANQKIKSPFLLQFDYHFGENNQTDNSKFLLKTEQIFLISAAVSTETRILIPQDFLIADDVSANFIEHFLTSMKTSFCPSQPNS